MKTGNLIFDQNSGELIFSKKRILSDMSCSLALAEHANEYVVPKTSIHNSNPTIMIFGIASFMAGAKFGKNNPDLVD